jgi:hypothetical protein
MYIFLLPTRLAFRMRPFFAWLLLHDILVC